VQERLGHSSILTTARYTHLKQTTGRTAEQAINALVSGIAGANYADRSAVRSCSA
jgi:site-specific recombinase XerC